MEIEKKNTRMVDFSTLEVGDVFLDEDGAVFIVVDKDYGLGECDSYYGYAVDLRTGWHYGIEADEKVIKVSAKLTITD